MIKFNIIYFFCFLILLGCVQEPNKANIYNPIDPDNTPTPTATPIVDDDDDDTNNSAPEIGIDQTVTTDENIEVDFTLYGAFDAEDDQIHYVLVTPPTYGTISSCLTTLTSTSLNCTYTPNADFAGTDSFTYRAHDRRLYSAENATVNIIISGIENVPTFISGNSANIGSADEDVPVVLTYRIDEGGGSDENAQTMRLSVTSTNAAILPTSSISATYAGTAIGTADNSPLTVDNASLDASANDLVITLTPLANIAGTSTITITISDGISSVNRSFDVTFNAVNDPPVLPTVAQVDATVINEDAGIQALADITIASDVEDAAATITYQVVSDVVHGTLSNCMGLTNDRTCEYTPDANYSGSDSFTYQAFDGTDYSTTIATVNLTVTNDNDAPVVAAKAFTVDEGDIIVLDDQDLNTTDIDNDADEIVYTVTAFPAAGKLYKAGVEIIAQTFTQDDIDGGLITYEQDGSEVIADSFNFSVADLEPLAVVDTVTITITPTNDPPVINPGTDCAHAGINQDLLFSCNVVPDASDIETNAITWSKHATDTCSWASILPADGTVSGTPDDDDVGTCTLKIVATDSLGAASSSMDFSIVVTNIAPVFTNAPFTATIDEDDPVAMILDADTSEEGFGTYSLVTPLAPGVNPACTAKAISLTINASTGVVSYQPSANFFGTCYVGIKFDDGNAGGAITSDLVVTVNPVDDPPTINTNISNQTTNINTPIRLRFRLSEDSAGTEEADGLQFQVTSDNNTIVDVEDDNLVFATYDELPLTNNNGVFTLGDTTDASNDYEIELTINPIPGADETVTISINADTDPASVSGWTTLDTFNLTVNDVAVFHHGFYDIFANGQKTDRNGTVLNSINPTLSFKWNSFDAVNANISSWRIYRNFDYTTPHATISSVLTRSYTDTTITSSDQNKLYYYEVVPVMDNGYEAWPEFDARVLRVIVPPKNMTLVHRLTANHKICAEIGSTSDPLEYNSCPYTGPGNSWNATYDISVYDLGHDLLIDMHELGCRYTKALCNGGDGLDCIGTADPNGVVNAAAGSLYYRRSTGACYQNSDGGINSWDSISDLAPALSTDFAQWVNDPTDYPNEAKLPPLTNISQQAAWLFCQAPSFKPTITDPIDNNFTTTNVSLRRLPTRKEQIIASKWASSATAEVGSSLPTSFYCNTVNGSGLTYDNINYGEGIWPYSYHATNASNIRSVITGSNITLNCKSEFSLYDAVGNVAEWTSDRIKCLAVGNNICEAVNSNTNNGDMLDSNNDSTFFYTSGSGVQRDYAFDGDIGPCRDSDNDGVCDVSNLTSWTFYNATPVNNASEFFLPVGLPAVADVATNEATATTLTIGTDLASSYFNSDSIAINAQTINAAADIGGAITGGSYKNGGDTAGRFSIEFFPAESYAAPYIGFRCAVQVDY